MTNTLEDVVMAVQFALPSAERNTLLDHFCARNPHWRGAHVADILAELLNRDAHLDLIEPLHEEHGHEVPEPGLLTVAALACIVRDGPQVVSWQVVQPLIARARSLLQANQPA